jgi:hypothetical protein
MKRHSVSLALCGLLGMLAVNTNAQTISAAPAQLNFQGRLAKPDGTPVPNGTYSIRFSLWDTASGGTEKWNQTINNVVVRNGTFAALLNTNTSNLFAGNLWLEIKIGTDAPLTPRQQLVSVAYAMKANSVPDGSITANSLASGALNTLSWLLSGNAASASHFLGTTNNQPLVFKTNNTERMRLLPSGNLGIGVSAPDSPLHISGPDNNGTVGTLKVVSGTQAMVLDGNELDTNTPLYINHNSNNSVFLATGGGNVGIGTPNPSRKLDVRGGDIALTNASGALRTLAAVNSGSDAGYFQIFNSANSLIAGLGGDTTGGEIYVRDGTGANTISLAGSTGEMTAKVVTITGGSDVAEPYNVAPAGDIAAIPGMVVAIDPDRVGQMRVVSRAYDTTVAGIISGANGINPGITLRQKGTIADGELPVASIGRVWCWCDADASGEIKAGDLLTTSDTPGHAMKAVDKERRDGAVIGKAMSSLKSGKGLVLVLVSLK